MNAPIRTAPALTRAEAVARARALMPAIAARAPQAIVDRRCPDATIAELKQAGLLRLMQPKIYGGSEQGWDVFCEVIELLAEACGSQGWVYRVLGDHGQMMALFPAEAQQDVWGSDHDALASSSFMPVGKGVPVAGGYRVSGRYSFSSGIDHADWIIAGGRVPVADMPDKTRAVYFLLPRADVTVIDDWFTNGLEGSGSKSFEITEAFVPAHRVLDWDEAAMGTAPGSKIHDAPVYRLPRGGYTTTGFSALSVGMARGMMNEWLDTMASRKVEGKAVAGFESTQMVVGEAALEVEAAQAFYRSMLREAFAVLERGETLPPAHAMQARATAAYAGRLVLAAVNRLHAAMGSSAVYSGKMMEAQFRNVLVGLQHVGMNWPRSSAGLGAMLLRDHGAEIGK